MLCCRNRPHSTPSDTAFHIRVFLGDAWLDEHIAADNALKRLIVENVASSHRTLKVREYNEAL